MHNWQLQEAKAKFSKVVQETLVQGPQQITVHGKPAVVLISRSDYDRLTRSNLSFGKFMRQSPFVGLHLNLERDKSINRDIEL